VTYRDESQALAEKSHALEIELALKSKELATLREQPRSPVEATVRGPRRAAAALAALSLALFASMLLLDMTGVVRPPFDVVFPGLGVSSLALLAVASALFVRSMYVVVPAGLAMITSLGRGPSVTMPAMARLVWPTSTVSFVSIAPRAATAELSLSLRDEVRASFTVTARVAPTATIDGVLRFHSRWSDGRQPELDAFLASRIDAAAREVLTRFEQSSLDADRPLVEDELRDALGRAIESDALSVIDVSFSAREFTVRSASQ
jgi:hypothetical protein